MWKIILLILAGLYTLNPYDIVPDLLVGWGWLDDVIIWILLWRFLASRKIRSAGNYGFYEHRDPRFKTHDQKRSSSQKQSDQNGPYAGDTGPWDPYRMLGVDRSASADEIKHAYRELANKYHPDKLAHLGDEFKELAEKRFKEIQRAYQELTGKGA
jgi:DnaJ like chaperone protein